MNFRFRILILFFIALMTLSLITNQPAFASSNNYEILWEKTFGDVNITQKGIMGIETMDGGFCVLGDEIIRYPNQGNIPDIFIIKTDKDGNQIWNKTFEKDSQFYTRNGKYVGQTQDGGFIVISERHDPGKWEAIWVVKLDSNGNTEWDERYSSTYYSVGKELSDGGCIAAGTGTKSYYPRIIKISNDGVKEWTKEYYFTKNIVSISESNNDGYLITRSDGVLVKINNTGEILWTKDLGYDSPKFYGKTSDGNHLLIGTKKVTSNVNNLQLYTSTNKNIYLFKIDENGNEVWNKTAGHYNGSSLTIFDDAIDASGLKLSTYGPRFSIQSSEDGYYFFVKRSTYYPSSDEPDYKSPLWITKLDSNFNKQGNLTLNDVPVESVFYIGNGKYILTGLKSDGGKISWSTEATDAYLLKIKISDYFTQADSQISDSKTPGFEIFTSITAIMLILYIKTRKQ